MCFGTGCFCDYLVSLCVCVKKHGCLHCKLHRWLWDKGWSQISRRWSVVFKPQVLHAGNYTKKPNYLWCELLRHHTTSPSNDFFDLSTYYKSPSSHLIHIYIHMGHTYAICIYPCFSICSLIPIYLQQSLRMSHSTGFSGSDLQHPTFRNRPHMHHAIEPWMAQVRMGELLPAAKPTDF